MDLSGLMEVEGQVAKSKSTQGESDLEHSTLELGLEHKLNKQLDLEVVFLYEEGEGDGGQVDQALVRFNELSLPVEIVLGLQYLPFGSFSSNLINDPLTLELAETSQAAVNVHSTGLPINLGLALYKGAIEHTDTEWQPDWTFYTEYTTQNLLDISINAYLSSELVNSNALSELVSDEILSERIPGGGIAIQFAHRNNSLDLECITATAQFKTGIFTNQKPSACHFEYAYEFAETAKNWTVALGYSSSQDAFILELPENRASVGISASVMQNVSMGFELLSEKDYGINQGGTGERTQAAVAQIGIEF